MNRKYVIPIPVIGQVVQLLEPDLTDIQGLLTGQNTVEHSSGTWTFRNFSDQVIMQRNDDDWVLINNGFPQAYAVDPNDLASISLQEVAGPGAIYTTELP